jgi:amino acid transporter
MSSESMATPDAGSSGAPGTLSTVSDEYHGRHLVKTIRWWDGFVLALSVPGFLFPSLGGSVAALGALGAIIVWLISVVMGALQNNIYAELATMMPYKSGGIGIYANEGIKRYATFVGPLVTWGYWFAWSTVLSIFGLLVGDYMQAELWPTNHDPNLPKWIGTVMLLGLWAFNIVGLRPGVWLSYLLGVLTMIPMLIVMFVPFLNGSFHAHNLLPLVLPNHVGWLTWAGISLMLSWLYIAGWSSYGFECVATFAPEFTNTLKDTPRALRLSAIFSVLVYGLVPLGLVGVLGVGVPGKSGVQANIYTAFDPALKAILGNGLGTVIVIMVVASLVLSANVATMDGSRALWQMSKDRMTVTWLSHLNRRGVPDAGMTLDLLVQLVLMWTIGSPLYILAAGNLGYILCHVCALVAFILLRRDQPNAVRPLRLGSAWVGMAGVLAALNVVFIVIGGPTYGMNSLLIGIGILLVALALYLFRIYVQDRQPAVQVAKS